MHVAAYEFVRQYGTTEPIEVIEIGSRDINGSAQDHFPNALWTGLDLYPGPRVDVVCNATEYEPETPVDLVICCEVLEHAEDWRELIRVGAKWLQDGGKLIVTCAGPGRKQHSAVDGGTLRAGEYYRNLTAYEVAEQMRDAGLQIELFRHVKNDTQAVGTMKAGPS